MKIIIMLILSLTGLHIYSQQKQILDKDTNEKIPYATLIFYQNNKVVSGFYSDENGFFDFDQNLIFNKLNISCIGYNTITIDNLKSNFIYMSKKIFELEEVIITNDKKIKLGFVDTKKTNDKVGVSIGLEVAVFIKNDLNYPAKINSILFNVNKTKNKILYRVHLYVRSNDGLYPTDDLITENIIQTIEPNTKGLIEIDLSMLGITLPKEGVFVGIEGLSGNNLEKTFGRNKANLLQFEVIKSDEQIYFEKNTLNGVGWVNFNKWLPDDYFKTFNKEYDRNKLFVPCFGIKIVKIKE